MSAVSELLKTMKRLRAPDGCPWDREQTHRSLARCLIEECAELLEAIDREDPEDMREELGDVLLQVVFHAEMAEERGIFSFEEVAAGINEKLIRRHPHVFGSAEAEDSEAVHRQWDAIKAAENVSRKRKEVFLKEGPSVLPALLYAWDLVRQLQKKELLEEAGEKERFQRLAEGLDEGEAGRKLFEIVAACRLAGIDPESALRRYSSDLRAGIEEKFREG